MTVFTIRSANLLKKEIEMCFFFLLDVVCEDKQVTKTYFLMESTTPRITKYRNEKKFLNDEISDNVTKKGRNQIVLTHIASCSLKGIWLKMIHWCTVFICINNIWILIR